MALSGMAVGAQAALQRQRAEAQALEQLLFERAQAEQQAQRQAAMDRESTRRFDVGEARQAREFDTTEARQAQAFTAAEAERMEDRAYRGRQEARQGTADRKAINLAEVRKLGLEGLRSGAAKPRDVQLMMAGEGVDVDQDVLDPGKAQRDRVEIARIQQANRQPRAGIWVTRNGRPVRMTEEEIQPGDVPFSQTTETTGAQDRQRVARTTAAKGFLTRLNELRAVINTKMGPAAGATGLVRRGGAELGMDPDVAEYERTRAAGGRALAVAIMGAQNLSDQDANAWANMLPDARTDAQTAERLTRQVETMLEGMTGGQPAAPPPGNVTLTPEQEARARALLDRYRGGRP